MYQSNDQELSIYLYVSKYQIIIEIDPHEELFHRSVHLRRTAHQNITYFLFIYKLIEICFKPIMLFYYLRGEKLVLLFYTNAQLKSFWVFRQVSELIEYNWMNLRDHVNRE